MTRRLTCAAGALAAMLFFAPQSFVQSPGAVEDQTEEMVKLLRHGKALVGVKP